MRRVLVALALAWGLTAEAQPLTGGLLGRGSSSTPATCLTAGQVPFLLSPTTLGLGCDSGLTYDAATDTLTSGRYLSGQGSAASPAFAPYAGYGMYADQPNGKLWFSIAGTARMSLTAGPTLALNGANPTIQTVKTYYVGTANTTLWTAGGAGKFQHGDADAAVPVMQTIQPQSVAAGTADTPGQPFNFDGSKGTGTGAGGPLVRSTAYPGASGTAQNTLSNREHISSGWTTLTESSATAFATLTFGASTVVGADFLVTIHAADATNNQVATYRVRVNSVRDATGNTQSTIGIIDDSATLPVAAGSGTLTSGFSVTEGAGAVTINATAVSSLTQTTLRASFQASANGAGLVVGPVGF